MMYAEAGKQVTRLAFAEYKLRTIVNRYLYAAISDDSQAYLHAWDSREACYPGEAKIVNDFLAHFIKEYFAAEKGYWQICSVTLPQLGINGSLTTAVNLVGVQKAKYAIQASQFQKESKHRYLLENLEEWLRAGIPSVINLILPHLFTVPGLTGAEIFCELEVMEKALKHANSLYGYSGAAAKLKIKSELLSCIERLDEDDYNALLSDADEMKARASQLREEIAALGYLMNQTPLTGLDSYAYDGDLDKAKRIGLASATTSSQREEKKRPAEDDTMNVSLDEVGAQGSARGKPMPKRYL